MGVGGEQDTKLVSPRGCNSRRGRKSSMNKCSLANRRNGARLNFRVCSCPSNTHTPQYPELSSSSCTSKGIKCVTSSSTTTLRFPRSSLRDSKRTRQAPMSEKKIWGDEMGLVHSTECKGSLRGTECTERKKHTHTHMHENVHRYTHVHMCMNVHAHILKQRQRKEKEEKSAE